LSAPDHMPRVIIALNWAVIYITTALFASVYSTRETPYNGAGWFALDGCSTSYYIKAVAFI